MSEVKDYKKFREKVIQLPWDRCDRIENVMVLGMPDVNCCIHGNEFWIEIKSPKEPKRKTTKLFGSNHKLSQDQQNWFLRQANANGLGFVLICTNKRWMLIDGCKHADKINDLTVDELIAISLYNFELGERMTVPMYCAEDMREIFLRAN